MGDHERAIAVYWTRLYLVISIVIGKICDLNEHG